MCFRVTTESMLAAWQTAVSLSVVCAKFGIISFHPGLWPPVVAEELRIQIRSLTGNIGI